MINKELSEKLGYDYSVLTNYINNWKPVKELEKIASQKDGRLIRKLADNERQYFDLGWYELKKAKPELEITYQEFVDNKITIKGQQRKLFKYLNDKELSELVGKYKLPKKDLYVVISVNFEDFLLCSTKNSWTACTNLVNGDFRYTALSNIFMDGRFICYITDMEEKEFEGAKSYNMFFRCFGFVNEDGQLCSNIWYPIKEYMNIDSLGVIAVNSAKNKKSKYGIHRVFNKFETFIYPYLDYCVFTGGDRFEFANEYLKFEPIVEFKDGNIAFLSEYTKFTGELGLENMLWSWCSRCGSKIGVQTYGEKNLCKDCVKVESIKCFNCGKYIYQNEAQFTEDNKWICKDCIPMVYKRQDVKRCVKCNTLVRKKGEDCCKYCRSDKKDAFQNIEFSYLDKNYNKFDYFKHHYVSFGDIPPGIKYDEEVFEETEKYIKR